MSLTNILEGLKIFAAKGGHMQAEHDQVFAGQADGVKLTKKEVLTLFNNSWFPECGGCAEEDDKSSDLFHDPDDDEDEVTQHRYTCNEWSHFT